MSVALTSARAEAPLFVNGWGMRLRRAMATHGERAGVGQGPSQGCDGQYGPVSQDQHLVVEMDDPELTFDAQAAYE